MASTDIGWALITAAACMCCQSCSFMPSVDDNATFYSTDGRRVARVQGGQVLVDGVSSKVKLDSIYARGVAFSRDGSRVAYVGQRGSKYYAVVDDKEFGPFDSFGEYGVEFSPGGGHMSFAVRVSNRWQLWVDGQPGDMHDGFARSHPFYSLDDRHIGYAYLDGGTWSLWQDGSKRPLGAAIMVGGFGFTTEGKVIATYKSKEGWVVRVGDQLSDSFDAINKPGLIRSPDGKTVAFVGQKGNKARVCVDSHCGTAHRMIGARALVDSSIFPDGFWTAVLIGALGTAASASAGDSSVYTVVPNGAGSKTYATVASVVFSPNSEHYAYVANDAREQIVVDTVQIVEIPQNKRVEWMKFDELSLALMYRLAGSHSALAVRVLGAKGTQKEGSHTADARLSVASTHADALISIDEDYVGMAPLSIALPSGRHMVRVQSPGRVTENIEIVLAAGESATVNATLKDDPIRVVVTEALVRLKDADLAPISEKNADQAIRGRLVTSMPLSEEVLGVAKVSAGEGALVFGEKNIYAVTEHSASSTGPLFHVIPYEEFVRQIPTVEHPWFSVMLTARAELSVAGMAIGKKTLVEFLERLRRELKAAIPAAS